MAKDTVRINRMIRVPQVRVLDAEGNQLGVMAIQDALKAADEAGLDLVEISPTAAPPVCRIMDHGKFKYQQSKKAKDARKKQTVVHIKEVKLRGKTEEHDFQFKVRNIKRFLGEGDKVKVTIVFKGREITHTELGRGMLKRVSEELKELAVIEAHPKLEGKSMTMFIAPAQQK
ncbi:MAG: translation initiation factor IF-3 [Deltaproteobacteria bacterium]|nr:translation initiation factor IF-3 [Deltaproteobacteria bacterium]MBI5809618.1 translation initiation factor IF-3 [Deltaproteobacteria bacterium]